MNAPVLRQSALTMVTVWSLFWTFFAAGEGITEHAWLWPAIAGLVFLGSLAVAWNWSLAGGVLLMMEGLTVCLLYPAGVLHSHSFSQTAFVVGFLALPPILSGALLLAANHFTKMHPAG